LWEYDAGAAKIAWATFGSPAPQVGEAVARLESRIRGELGECQSLGMDWPRGRMQRIAALHEMAAVHA